MNPTRAITLTWNCCPGTREPDWGIYDALELAGCVAGKGWVERVEEGTTPSFYTVVYGHLVDGGCDEALHGRLSTCMVGRPHSNSFLYVTQ